MAADVVGAVEAAEILGVSRRRFYEILDVHKDFPAAVGQLSRGKVWSKADVERWAKSWARKPGRPWPEKKKTPGRSRGL